METKIAFLTITNPYDKSSWSGIIYNMFMHLQKHCGNVECLGPISQPLAFYIGGLFSRLSRKIFNKRYDYYHNILLARAYAEIFEKKLSERQYDYIFATPFTTPIANLKTNIPIVYYSDSVFSRMLNYYPVYSNLYSFSEKIAWRIEKAGLERCELLIFSSEWAAEAAIRNFNIASKKVFVVPMGANIEKPPSKEKIFFRKKNNKCRLLFIGKEWERKGGEIAYETLLKLRAQGIDAELTVCGCIPSAKFRDPYLKIIPYLDKNNPDDFERLTSLYLEADFFILPTRAEAFGIVFCEASAFGIPSITADTGGVRNAVYDGINGIVLPYHARGDAYAKVIIELLNNERKYNELRRSSRQIYEEKLNWNSWALAIKKIIVENLR